MVRGIEDGVDLPSKVADDMLAFLDVMEVLIVVLTYLVYHEKFSNSACLLEWPARL